MVIDAVRCHFDEDGYYQAIKHISGIISTQSRYNWFCKYLFIISLCAGSLCQYQLCHNRNTALELTRFNGHVISCV